MYVFFCEICEFFKNNSSGCFYKLPSYNFLFTSLLRKLSIFYLNNN